MYGITLRLKRIFNNDTKKTIILPLDHGVSNGAIQGLWNLRSTLRSLCNTQKIDAVLAHRRMVSLLTEPDIPALGSILHCSASTTFANANKKVLVATVEEALHYGIDALSVHINLGESEESTMLKDFGMLVSKANTMGVPVLAMMYVRRGTQTSTAVEDVQHAARVADDLGASIIKVPYTGTIEGFSTVVSACTVPVVVAGGIPSNDVRALLQNIYDALQAGARGISIGRGIFAATHPEALLNTVHLIVHNGMDVEKAFQLYTVMSQQESIRDR